MIFLEFAQRVGNFCQFDFFRRQNARLVRSLGPKRSRAKAWTSENRTEANETIYSSAVWAAGDAVADVPMLGCRRCAGVLTMNDFTETNNNKRADDAVSPPFILLCTVLLPET